MKNRLKRFCRFIISTVKDAAGLLRFNAKPILLFVVIYAFVGMFVTITVNKLVTKLGFAIVGTQYLSADNIHSFLSNPFTYLILIVFFIFLACLGVFQLSALAYACRMSCEKTKITISEMVSHAERKCIQSLVPKNALILLMILFLMPSAQLINITSSTIYLAIPEFILDYISASKALSALYVAAQIAIFLMAIICLFTVMSYVASDMNLKQSISLGNQTIKRHIIRTIAMVFITYVLILVLTLGVSSVVSTLIFRAVGFFTGNNGTLTEQATVSKVVSIAVSFLSGIISPAISVAVLASMHREVIDDNPHISIEPFRAPVARHYKAHYSVYLLFIVVCVLVNFNTAVRNDYFFNEKISVPKVVAHRGDSINAPENSLPAIELAVDEGIEWIEIDVHQTEDGVIVVCHDDDLRRVSGQNVRVHSLTYEELEKLDVGSWFSKNYAGLKMPTLEEVLKACKGKANLLIELKPTGYETDYEQSVIDVINSCGMHDSCVIHCEALSCLEKVKELDPTMTVYYCMYLAWGDISSIECADGFTVEEACIDQELVSNVHAAGKTIYAWTVNDEDNVQYLIDCGVDGIITDTPVNMNVILGECDYSTGFMKLCRLCANLALNGY